MNEEKIKKINILYLLGYRYCSDKSSNSLFILLIILIRKKDSS